MTRDGGTTGLAERLVDWMAENRPGLDALMSQEGSRAIHEEFMLAESGELPDRATRVERARGASARAWMRHLGHALAAEWPGAAPGLADALERWMGADRERFEALLLEERAAAERRGASGDPQADARDAELAAWTRLFAEGIATISPADPDEPPPAFSLRVATWSRAQESRRRAVEDQAREAWGGGPPGSEQRMTAAPEADEVRVREAAAVWAHVRLLAEALEQALASPPREDDHGPEPGQG